MKTATFFEIGKTLARGTIRMAGNLLRVLSGRDRAHPVLPDMGTEAAYQGTPFWISKRQGS